MRNLQQRAQVVACMAVVLGFTPSQVGTCGLCPQIRGGLTVVHPKSIQVAIAIRRDLDTRLLKWDPTSVKPDQHRQFGNLQVGQVLAVRHGLREGFELLLIEDGARYRIDNLRRLRGRKRPAWPPIRWVTGRAVLQALLKKELTLETAVKRGLLVVEKTLPGDGAKAKRASGSRRASTR
jgi:hypothetical protein